MPPLEASWAVSQRARHPIGPWGLMVVSNRQPIAYDAIALPIELIKYGRVFYTDYHPNVREPTSHPVPSDSHIGGFCIVLSPVFFSPAFATTDKTSGYLQVQYLLCHGLDGTAVRP